MHFLIARLLVFCPVLALRVDKGNFPRVVIVLRKIHHLVNLQSCTPILRPRASNTNLSSISVIVLLILNDIVFHFDT